MTPWVVGWRTGELYLKLLAEPIGISDARDWPSQSRNHPDSPNRLHFIMMTNELITISGLSKVYDNGFKALDGVDLAIQRGEILALLGPNGAGKTTLISIVCGLTRASEGRVLVDGHDVVTQYRLARRLIGLVPQELTTDAFESVVNAVAFSRGLFGLRPAPDHIEQILRELSLWDKRDSRIMTLSGGMKRRLLIAKALAHEPRILFLDEPTAGVDVELRKDMWALIHRLRATGVTVILTTHYIEEAEAMADRVGVINHGRIILVEDKQALMRKLGRKQLVLHLSAPAPDLPEALADNLLSLSDDRTRLTYTYDAQADDPGIGHLLTELQQAGFQVRDLHTDESSLEEIFVTLVNTR